MYDALLNVLLAKYVLKIVKTMNLGDKL